MRDVYPVKYYKDEGFVEYKIEIDEGDLPEILEDYLRNHSKLDFDEVAVVNNRPMNVWLYVKCRKYLDLDGAKDQQAEDAEVEVSGKYDGNPTGT